MLIEKLVIPRLEIHVSNYCNLNCNNCNHFSNYGITGSITLDKYKEWNYPWVKRIFPKTYQLMGGEPTINSELSDICISARNFWRKSRILLVSNGFFLSKHKDLPEILYDFKIELIISIHHDSLEYKNKLEEIKQLISDWQLKYPFKYHYRESYKNWFKTFKVDDKGNTIPFDDGNPSLSFSNCLSKDAKQLFHGKIYKCPPLTYLKLIKDNFDLSDKWDFYLEYKPLLANCTKRELYDFFALKEESYCNMCASEPKSIVKENPLIQLSIKRF